MIPAMDITFTHSLEGIMNHRDFDSETTPFPVVTSKHDPHRASIAVGEGGESGDKDGGESGSDGGEGSSNA